MSKIYLASSWKNAEMVHMLAGALRSAGHVVDDFTDGKRRETFTWEDVPGTKREDLNAITFLKIPRSQEAFAEDKKWLDWCDTCILILPAGNSAHLEAGYAVGSGKRLFIFGRFPEGKFDLMYGFANKLVRELPDLREALKECDL